MYVREYRRQLINSHGTLVEEPEIRENRARNEGGADDGTSAAEPNLLSIDREPTVQGFWFWETST